MVFIATVALRNLPGELVLILDAPTVHVFSDW